METHILQPAEEVDDGPYVIEDVVAPVLQGSLLKVFVWITESPFSLPIRNILLRKNGIAQLAEVNLPETPLPVPAVPLPPFESWEAGVEPHVTDVQEMGLKDRINAAYKACFSSQPHHKPLYPTIQDYHEAYLSGTITPSEVAENAIEAIARSESRQPPLRIFIAHNPEDVRSQAQLSTQRFKAGAPLGPLDGVPYVVKDTIDALPYDTTEGSGWVAGTRVVASDSSLVRRLRDSGAVLLGKTNMHELGMGTTGLNLRWGTPRNPHNTAHHTGGSSSGNGAALALGLCPFALGTDGGGSIRIPASYCGLVGLKPTHFRVSVRREDHPFSGGSVAVFGPMGTSVRDVVCLYAALANTPPPPHANCPQPPLTLPSFPHALGAGAGGALRGMKMAVYWKWFEHADEEVVRVCKAALTLLESAGAEVLPVTIPELELLEVAHAITISSETKSAIAGYYQLPRVRHCSALDNRLLMAVAEGFGSVHYVQAQRVRRRLTTHMERVLGRADIIVAPMAPTTAPLIPPAGLQGRGVSNLPQAMASMRFSRQANFCGYPALALPVGHGDKSGLPVGLQLIGRFWTEATLLRVGAVLEEAVSGQLSLPPGAVNLLLH